MFDTPKLHPPPFNLIHNTANGRMLKQAVVFTHKRSNFRI